MSTEKISQFIKNKDFELLGDMLHMREIEDLNALLPNGETLLTFAAQHGDAVDIEVIMNFGGDPDVKNKAGIDARQAAMKVGNHLNYKALIETIVPEKGKPASIVESRRFFDVIDQDILKLDGKLDFDQRVAVLKTIPGKSLIEAMKLGQNMGLFEPLVLHDSQYDFYNRLKNLAFDKAVIDGDQDCVDYFNANGNIEYTYTIKVHDLLRYECKNRDLLVRNLGFDDLLMYQDKFTLKEIFSKIKISGRKVNRHLGSAFIRRMDDEGFKPADYFKSISIELNDFINEDIAFLKKHLDVLSIDASMLSQLSYSEMEANGTRIAKDFFAQARALGVDFSQENRRNERGDLIQNALSVVVNSKPLCKKEVIEDLLKDGIDINEKFAGDKTLLDYLLIAKNFHAAEVLIEMGAVCTINPAEKFMRSITPDFNGRSYVGKGEGALVNIRDLQGRTVLIHAVKNEQEIPVREVIERGGNPHIKDNKGMNALAHCFALKDERARDSIAKIIMEAMSDPRFHPNPELMPIFQVKKDSRPSMRM